MHTATPLYIYFLLCSFFSRKVFLMILSICSETVRLVYNFSLLIFAGVAVGLRQQLQILL